ncbi:MAG: KPN_02809 family neutral zinc metallopeptidase [Sphingosinicella sp.]|uniref:KPN_02809 family neutral zinc metallopeptidase n=1 Tax=Sphingosinicella sp. TaxID=1917971 RepID=UPI004037EDFC
MRFGGRRTSDNVESQRGMGFGGGRGGLGGGAGLLFGLVASRFGIGGIVVLFLVFALFGGLGDIVGGCGQQSVGPQTGRPAESAANVCQSDEVTRFSCQVLASTEEQWGAIYQAAGERYAPPRLVFYAGGGRSGCGAADAQMGPFYCPADQRIYLDTSFFSELARRFGAPGDFAQAYVIAHEVGHHIQTIDGTSDRIRRAQSAVREGDANAMQVQMELQADCLAGVWASRERGAMEAGDLGEGMRAAAAIGDDTLQRAERGTVVPESFTHGTSAQRQEALMRGYNSGGNPAACQGYTQRF